VAPGTSVVIRTVGSDPYAPGVHREMTKWARDIQRGPVRAMPELKRDTTRSDSDGDTFGSISVGATTGGSCYVVAVLLVGVAFNLWPHAIVVGLTVGVLGLLIVVIARNVRRRAGADG
jgi:hypothetical protein